MSKSNSSKFNIFSKGDNASHRTGELHFSSYTASQGNGMILFTHNGTANDRNLDFRIDNSSKLKIDNTKIEINTHILPSSNAVYDLGSAEYKIRHLFLSDNSLWIGDTHKISIDNGQMKFRKRKTNVMPKSIQDTFPGENDEAKRIAAEQHRENWAAANASGVTLENMKLNQWEAYAKTIDGINSKGLGLAEVNDIFRTNEVDDYEEQFGSNSWIETGANIHTLVTNVGIGVANPKTRLEIDGTVTTKKYRQKFIVKAAGGKYHINGRINPIITLQRGKEYEFDLSDSSTNGHPFYITHSSNGGSNGSTGAIAKKYDTQDGLNMVTGNGNHAGTTNKTVIFSVPDNAPGSLYYHCSAHSGMGNKINIDGTLLSDSLGKTRITVDATSNENIIRFNTNNEERIKIDSSGNLAVKSGNLVLGGSTHYTTITPNTSGNGLTLNLPNSAGTSGQYLQTDGSGALSWNTISSDSITEGDTIVEVVDTGSDGHIKFSTDGTERMRLDNTGSLLVDTLGEKTSAAGVTIDGVLVKDNKVRIGDGTNNTTLAAAGSGGALTLTLPSSAGSSGQYLQTDGSGALSWNTISSDSITEGDTIVEVVDTGSDGHIKFSTDGTERMRLDNTGKLGINYSNPRSFLEIRDNSSTTGSTVGCIRLSRGADIEDYIDFENQHTSGQGSGLVISSNYYNGSARVKKNIANFHPNGNITTGGTLDIPGATNTTSSLLVLKNGTNAGDYNKSPQIQFAYNNGGTQYSHFIVSRHSGSSHHHNALDFYLCNTTPNNSISSGVNRVLTIDKQSTIINSFTTTIGGPNSNTFPLTVYSSSSQSRNDFKAWVDGPLGTVGWVGGGNQPAEKDFSIYCEKFYLGLGLWCFSDERIKKNFENPDNSLLLQKLENINLQKYEYIDKLNNNSGKIYGFKAQDIKNEIESSVTLNTGVIPNYFEMCEVVDKKIKVKDNHDLVVGDKIRIYDDNMKETKITNIEDNLLTVEEDIDGNEVFLYGKEVDDFHSLNWDVINGVHIGATKEIIRRLKNYEQENAVLKSQYNDLLNRIILLENK